MPLGLISDTHGLLRPQALEALQGSSLIIHAGDVGPPEILDQLRTIAPVIAVQGNVDKGTWASRLPHAATVEWRSRSIYILHDVKELDLDPVSASFHVVISGHSHNPGHTRRDSVLYVNPGSAGPRRFLLPITIARLELRESGIHVEYIDVSGDDLPDGRS
jgi:hypothetical protein